MTAKVLPFVPPPAPPPPPSTKKASALWIILPIACAVPVLLLLGLGGLGYLYAKGNKELPATAQDRALIVDVSALTDRVPGFLVDLKKEQLKKEKDAFGVVTISYEYQDQETESLYVKSSVSFNRNASDAKTSFGAARLGLEGYFAATGKLRTVSRNDLLEWGDDSESSLLMRGDTPVGNFFIARKDGGVFMLMVAGLYVEDPKILREVLLPRLEAMERYVVEK